MLGDFTTKKAFSCCSVPAFELNKKRPPFANQHLWIQLLLLARLLARIPLKALSDLIPFIPFPLCTFQIMLSHLIRLFSIGRYAALLLMTSTFTGCGSEEKPTTELSSVSDQTSVLQLVPAGDSSYLYRFEVCAADHSRCVPALIYPSGVSATFFKEYLDDIQTSHLGTFRKYINQQTVVTGLTTIGQGLLISYGSYAAYNHAYRIFPNAEELTTHQIALLDKLDNKGFLTVKDARASITNFENTLSSFGYSLSREPALPRGASATIDEVLSSRGHVFNDDFIHFFQNHAAEDLERLGITAEEALQGKASSIDYDRYFQIFADKVKKELTSARFESIRPVDYLLKSDIASYFDEFKHLKSAMENFHRLWKSPLDPVIDSPATAFLADVNEFVTRRGLPLGFATNISKVFQLKLNLTMHFPRPSQTKLYTSATKRSQSLAAKLLKSRAGRIIVVVVGAAATFGAMVATYTEPHNQGKAGDHNVLARYPALAAPMGTPPLEVKSVHRIVRELAVTLKAAHIPITSYCSLEKCTELISGKTSSNIWQPDPSLTSNQPE